MGWGGDGEIEKEMKRWRGREMRRMGRRVRDGDEGNWVKMVRMVEGDGEQGRGYSEG